MGAVSSSDVELLARFDSGFDVGFEELVVRYEHKLYSLCLNLTRSEMEAEAILSEVFCAALDELPRLIEDRASISTWMYRMVVERAGEREQTRLPELDIRFSPTHIEVLESGRAPIEQDDAELFRSAVQNLPYEYRVVYLLHESMELMLTQIRELLDLSELEARAFLHRARLMVCRHIRRFRGAAARPPFESSRARPALSQLLN